MRALINRICMLLGVIGALISLIFKEKFAGAKQSLLRSKVRARERALQESRKTNTENFEREVATHELIEKELNSLHARKHTVEEGVKGMSNEDVVSELTRRGF